MAVGLFICLLTIGASLVETRWLPETWACEDGAVPCLWKLGTCINQEQWCDGTEDCPYGSDEAYCHSTSKCLENHFTCKNGRCVPNETLCNGYDNCGDGSDEIDCKSNSATSDHTKQLQAVIQASYYLLSRRDSEYGWGDSTPRVLIALAFANKYSLVSEEEQAAMSKRLETQLLHVLKEGVKSVPLHQLAIAINSLYATCEDPRDFKEIDLVDLLRIQTNEALKTDLNLPIVFLALCLAKETRYEDFDKLLEIYDDKRSGIGQKALTLVVMASCRHQVANDHHIKMNSRFHEFIQQFKLQDDIGTYTLALVCQALNAWEFETSQLKDKLLQHQAEDGSFGSLLETNAAIPALLNTSLADLQCKSRTYSVKPAKSSVAVLKRKRQISYTLIIPDGQNIDSHTLNIEFDGRKSFHDLMRSAEKTSPMYGFSCDELDTGKIVTTLSGISNDPESGSTWTLYKQNDYSKDLIKEATDIDYLFPEDGDHYLYKYE